MRRRNLHPRLQILCCQSTSSRYMGLQFRLSLRATSVAYARGSFESRLPCPREPPPDPAILVIGTNLHLPYKGHINKPQPSVCEDFYRQNVWREPNYDHELRPCFRNQNTLWSLSGISTLQEKIAVVLDWLIDNGGSYCMKNHTLASVRQMIHLHSPTGNTPEQPRHDDAVTRYTKSRYLPSPASNPYRECSKK